MPATGFRPSTTRCSAKVIVHGSTRDEALARMRNALSLFALEGVHTTIPFLLQVLDDPDFMAGEFDTKFLERKMAEKVA